MKMNNLEIRGETTKKGLRLYELAELLGIDETSLSRKLRKELPEDEKQRILHVIRKGR